MALVGSQPDTLEADLQRVYGVDLADLWRGRLSPRRLAVLVANLPPDSATALALGEGVPGWTVTDYLLADVFHALTGEPHPGRPKPRASRRDLSATIDRLKAQRARLAARKQEG